MDPEALEEVLRDSPVLTLAMRGPSAPYVVPVCFGTDGGTLYVHSALAGAKIDLLNTDPVVGFCAFTQVRITPGADPCSTGMSARSVVGTGRCRILTDPVERQRGLDAIVRHYGGGAGGPYRPDQLPRTCVVAIHIDTLRGKTLEAPQIQAS